MNSKAKICAALLFAVLWFLTGCMNVAIGRKPDVSVLEQSLQIGESTRDDVRRILGEPFGTGRSFYPRDQQVNETWIYYYTQTTSKESHRLVLFVYFSENKFSGYAWWSSFPEGTQSKVRSSVPHIPESVARSNFSPQGIKCKPEATACASAVFQAS
jgi:outer membrane protein assembly factor BamE (lipoprotein component of BamABCDE complex)